MAKKNEKALVPQEQGFSGLANMDMAAMMAEELDGLDASFERIKIPSAGSTVYEVPGEDPSESESVKEFSAVILFQYNELLSEWCAENKPEYVPLFKLVQEYRRWGKIKSTYIDGYLGYLNSATDRIHPDLMPLATETGRFAARNPNLQNMSRAGADEVGIRNFFIAPEGKVLLSLDFSQIELRVGAFYCRDAKMMDTYRAGGDIHAQTTAVIYHIPFEQAVDKDAPDYKERRTIAKNCNFGTFFGLFPKGLQKTLKFKAGLPTPLSECERIINNLKAGYVGLTRWQEETKQQAVFRRYTETWLGRRRYLPNIASTDWGKKSFAERCALNTPIQGTAADILKLAIGRIIIGLSERVHGFDHFYRFMMNWCLNFRRIE